MYAFDLLGACAGAVAVVPLLSWLPTPQLAGALGLLPLAAYGLVGGSGRVLAGAAALVLALLAAGTPFAVRHSKVYDETRARTRPIWERWTPTARITVFDNLFFLADRDAPFGWGLGAGAPRGAAPEQYWIEQDGFGRMPVANIPGLPPASTHPPQQHAPHIGEHGSDILRELGYGAAEIDAIFARGGVRAPAVMAKAAE